MAAKEGMNTLTSPPLASAHEDWLDNCAFAPRHQSVAPSAPPATLTQKFENAVPPAPARPKRNIVPLIDGAFEPVTEFLPVVKQIRPLPDPLVAELHSFRQLSSPFFCPETSYDTLPEYILFGLIVLLAVAWPILAMLGVMARS
jgi:hypothetical protein